MFCATFKLHSYETLIVGTLIIFGWIINSISEWAFVIDDGFIIVNIYKVVFVLKISIIIAYCISNDNKECQLSVTSRYDFNDQSQTP